MTKQEIVQLLKEVKVQILIMENMSFTKELSQYEDITPIYKIEGNEGMFNAYIPDEVEYEDYGCCNVVYYEPDYNKKPYVESLNKQTIQELATLGAFGWLTFDFDIQYDSTNNNKPMIIFDIKYKFEIKGENIGTSGTKLQYSMCISQELYLTLISTFINYCVEFYQEVNVEDITPPASILKNKYDFLIKNISKNITDEEAYELMSQESVKRFICSENELYKKYFEHTDDSLNEFINDVFKDCYSFDEFEDKVNTIREMFYDEVIENMEEEYKNILNEEEMDN